MVAKENSHTREAMEKVEEANMRTREAVKMAEEP